MSIFSAMHRLPRLTHPAWLHGIATSVPEHRLTQDQILVFMKRLHGNEAAKSAFLDRIYANSAIGQRHSVLADYGLSPDQYRFYPPNAALTPPPGTAQRNECYALEAPKLATAAAQALFGDSRIQIDPHQITHLVTVSCTGFSAPGFDLDLIRTLGLPLDIKRTHIGFMGCNAAFPALNLAAEACAADPRARVLIVSVELCTLHFQAGWEPDQVVANALFADGAAAALVTTQAQDSTAPWFRIGARSSRIVPHTTDRMAWTIGDHGFEMVLSAYVPKVIEQELGGIIDQVLNQDKKSRTDIESWAIHPGGRAILDRVSQSLALPPQALEPSREILRDYGNMSSATIFFLLKKIAIDKQSQDKSGRLVFASSFGPGLTIESALLELHPTVRKKRQAWFFPRLKERSFEAELMDDPAIDSARLERTIRQFRLLNRLFSGYRSILEKELFQRIPMPAPGAAAPSYRVLDIGCGGGDILVWLARTARKRGIRLQLMGIDPDERTVQWAEDLVRDWPEIEIHRASHAELPELGMFDFIISNHVLHHLHRQTIVDLIRKGQAHARINLILNDLKRSPWAYIGYTIFTGLFIKRSLAFFDGRLSIRRGFRRPELESMVAEAGGGLEVRCRHPARLYTSRAWPLPSNQQVLQQNLEADSDQYQAAEYFQA